MVEVRRVDLEGDGVVEVAGRERRVPYVIPGEQVEVRLDSARSDREAELVRVVTPSSHRVTPGCQHFGPCGGCAWQHIAYAEQLRLKQQLLQRLLDGALGSRAPRVLETLPTPDVDEAQATATAHPLHRTPWHYRNKVHFVFSPGERGASVAMGHYRRGSRAVIPVVECPVHADAGNRVAFAMRDALEQARVPGVSGDGREGVARHVVIRVAEASADWLATLVVTRNDKPLRKATAAFLAAATGNVEERKGGEQGRWHWGVSLNVNDRPGPYLFGRETLHLSGERVIREVVAGIGYRLSPASFFQTNVRAARLLVREVLDALAGRDVRRVLDLYAGVGLFALPLARSGCTVTAVEENRAATTAAVEAGRDNQVPSKAFRTLAARVETVMPRLTPKRGSPGWDAVILDPPRQGCPAAVLDWILGVLRPPRIVYVSCNPEALAADLRRVPPAGYDIQRVRPIDMFPHTAHIESVAVLVRR